MTNIAIYQALANILSEVDAIGKNKTNQMQGYKFRGIDDMYNAIHPLFSKYKVFITSEVLGSEREERKTAKGGLLIYSIIDVKFTFWTIDGSSVSSTLKGEAMDSGDKATNKAISAALKYALMQMFLIPTEEKLDTEYESPAPVKKETKLKLTENQLKEAIERIQKGEVEIKEKIQDNFILTKDQQEKIKAANENN